jgi:sensor histidine kinase YesM
VNEKQYICGMTGKNNKLRIVLQVLLFSTVFTLLFKWWQTGNPFRASTLFSGFLTFLMVLASLTVWQVFFRKQMDRPVRQLKRIIIPLFAVYLAVVLIISFCIVALEAYLRRLVLGLDVSGVRELLIENEFPGMIRVYPVAIFIAFSLFFYLHWREAISREQQLREENLKHKYKSLKAQVNPHFLFNSLNTLSETVYTDAAKADRYIQKLAAIYRYILDNEDTDLISLEEELRFTGRYFELQKERNGDRIRLTVDFPHAGSFRIIPISLQLLVENALKHNSASEEDPLEISVCNRNDTHIVVANGIRKRNTLTGPNGTGLANLKERVKLITGREMVVKTENNRFTVALPVIKIQD